MRGVAKSFVLSCALCTSALAQIEFSQVQSQTGLNVNVLYGPTFNFSSDPPQIASIKRINQKNMGNGAAVGDYDSDGDLDIYVLRQSGFSNRLFRNDLTGGSRIFTDVTAVAGVGDLGLSRTAQFADLDSDGWDDLVLLNDEIEGGPYPFSKIYRNNGDGTFTDVTAGSGFFPFGLIKGGMCLGDYDGDGVVDIHVSLWLMEVGSGAPRFAGRNYLYRNLGDFQFEDVTFSSGLGLFQRDSFSCVFADFDNDRDADLYVAVDHTSDAYYRNNGDGTFTDNTVAVAATHTGNDMGIAVFDFDNDGDLDIYSTNITDPAGALGTTQFNTLLVNQLAETGSLAFVDQAATRGVRNTYWGWGTEFIDADNDSDLDLYAVNGFDEYVALFGTQLVDTPEVLFSNDGAGQFTGSAGTGADFIADARAAIAFDYNLDGRQDLLVTSILDPLVLLENRTLVAGHWLSVELIGRCGDNADALGGRVYVTYDQTQMREILAGGSYLSGRPFALHFGLGSDPFIQALRVVFPDGSEFRRDPFWGDRRVAILHETPTQPARMIISRNLRDVASFQGCMNAAELAACSTWDADTNRDGIIDLTDLPDFITGLDWSIPGCVPLTTP